MNRAPPLPRPAQAIQQPSTLPGDSRLDILPTGDERYSRWMGGRLRLLFAIALLGCVGLFLLVQWLADQPGLDAVWRATPQGHVELADSRDPRLHGRLDRRLVAVESQGVRTEMSGSMLLRPPRWITGDDARTAIERWQRQVATALAQPEVRLHFDDGSIADMRPRPRGVAHFGTLFWLICALALALYLVGWVVVMAGPTLPRVLFAVVALLQCAHLLLIAAESTFPLALPPPLLSLDIPLRTALDLLLAAAVVNGACLHPRRLPGSGWIALAAWGAAVGLSIAVGQQRIGHAWAWTQVTVAWLWFTAIALTAWSYRLQPHPFAMVMRRFGSAALPTWLLLTGAVALSAGTSAQQSVAAVGSTTWYVFLAALLLLMPFLSKSQSVVREFALLAAISTGATALDLVFVALFSLGPFASLAISLFVALGAYAGARQWLLNRLLGDSVMTTERMFEHLYRTAREVEAHPQHTTALLAELLHDVFEPIEVTLIERRSSRARVLAGGAAMLLPVPELGSAPEEADNAAASSSVLLRFAHRGRRLFTLDDARLAERIVEQLRRAVAYDRAVEQGRHEERSRIAQDLHDDIGARLLTLMYKAPTPEMEEYVRHTLKDLKTLTRGLAASSHRLSHAIAEWKADLSQRLTAADIALDWRAAFESDVTLSVVQWSALTRVLRELASNAIAHSRASKVSVTLELAHGNLRLVVVDDGEGRDPQAWSHGLGLGGVRKRVKQLGGEVTWRQCEPRGVCCEVIVPSFVADS